MSETPLWKLREELRRAAQEHIDGRRSFEEMVGRKSSKPIPGVVVSSEDMIRLLNDYDRLRCYEIAESVQEHESEEWWSRYPDNGRSPT